MAKSYKLGQVIYILSNSTQKIIPAIIAEEYSHKTIKENITTYKIGVGPKEKQTIVPLEKVEGEIYNSLTEIETILTNRLMNFIKEAVGLARDKSEKWYGDAVAASVPKKQSSENSEGKIDPSTLVIEETINKPNNKISAPSLPSNPQDSLRDKIKRMVDVEETMEDQETSDNTIITMPNGQQIKVKVNKEESSN